MSRFGWFFSGVATTLVGVRAAPVIHNYMIQDARERQRVLSEIVQEGMEPHVDTGSLRRRIAMYESLETLCQRDRSKD